MSYTKEIKDKKEAEYPKSFSVKIKVNDSFEAEGLLAELNKGKNEAKTNAMEDLLKIAERHLS